VGIYFVKGDVLVLGPWKGTQATEHTSIPLGRGVCGAAATSGKTELVDDVTKDRRYLSCFLFTRSEIVVPIKKSHVVLGEIDIDSDRPSAFDTTDVVFLEKVADMLSSHI
jgi:GAF domain-containing protein